ncbi:tetraspanin-18-like [Ananas comosus]|uniref:Tetraspanin-18-like n=1 Tax=Ananas comosus TaxID=4615 RepID=A0A6P5FNA2_ANACO|nr:tetraspanin-18-like [Ananas comosus]
MRPSWSQSSLGFLLKFLNYLQSFVGVSIVLYSVWLLSLWRRRSSDLHEPTIPWLVWTLMGFGILVCLITFVGLISAGAGNGCFLCCYAALIVTLILLEAASVGYIVFNKQWEQSFPHDATGELKIIRTFIDDNLDFSICVSVIVVVVQALSLVLAMLLRNMVLPRRLEDESNEDIPVSRKPLLGPRPDASTSIDRRISDDSLISQIRQKFGFESGQISEDVGENRFPQLATMPRS